MAIKPLKHPALTLLLFTVSSSYTVWLMWLRFTDPTQLNIPLIALWLLSLTAVTLSGLNLISHVQAKLKQPKK